MWFHNYFILFWGITAIPPTSNTCPINACLNGGSCQSVPGGSYRCLCQSGYTGSRCDLFIGILFEIIYLKKCFILFWGTSVIVPNSNTCATNVCNNGGTCQSVPGGGFRCICRPGFIGDFCTVICDSYDLFRFMYILFFL